jgi:hypothetical protein
MNSNSFFCGCVLRMVRDVFHVNGFLVMDARDQVVQIVLNQAAPLVDSLHSLLAPAHIPIHLGHM